MFQSLLQLFNIICKSVIHCSAVTMKVGAAAAKLAPSKVEEVLGNAWVSENARLIITLLIWTDTVAVKFLAMRRKLAIA